jgi:hypothetical protein
MRAHLFRALALQVWQLDNDPIVELIRGVAPQNFFIVIGYPCGFFGGIVSFILLPLSTKTMAKGSSRARLPDVLHERIATSIDYMVCSISWSGYRTPLAVPVLDVARFAHAV